jgi:hypothetical protein
MTVAELVARLQALPQDQEVWIRDESWGLRPVHAKEDTHDGGSWPWFTDRRKAWDSGDETEFNVVTL